MVHTISHMPNTQSAAVCTRQWAWQQRTRSLAHTRTMNALRTHMHTPRTYLCQMPSARCRRLPLGLGTPLWGTQGLAAPAEPPPAAAAVQTPIALAGGPRVGGRRVQGYIGQRGERKEGRKTALPCSEQIGIYIHMGWQLPFSVEGTTDMLTNRQHVPFITIIIILLLCSRASSPADRGGGKRVCHSNASPPHASFVVLYFAVHAWYCGTVLHSTCMHRHHTKATFLLPAKARRHQL